MSNTSKKANAKKSRQRASGAANPPRSATRSKRAVAEQRQELARKASNRAKWQTRAVIAAGVLLVCGVIGVAVWQARPQSGDTSADAWDLPAQANDPDDDGRIRLAEFAGEPLVVNFFANWCTACDAELPGFERVSDELRGQVRFVGVHTQEDGGALDLPREHGVDWWPVASDINGTIGGGSGLYESLRRTNGMPITAFYAADGQLLDVTSTLSESQLRELIARHYGPALVEADGSAQ